MRPARFIEDNGACGDVPKGKEVNPVGKTETNFNTFMELLNHKI